MNITLSIVVAAIVILITALVVITIFGSGMTNVGSIAQARSVCETQCEAACRATGQPPVTWDIPTIRDPNTQELKACNVYGSCTSVYCEGLAGGGGTVEYTCKGGGLYCNTDCGSDLEDSSKTCSNNAQKCCIGN